MSVEEAEAFMNRVESDEAFAAELESMRDDQAAVQAAVVAAGFDATTDEIRDAFVDRFGDQLTEEQLAAVAGGFTTIEHNNTIRPPGYSPPIVGASAAV